MTERPQPPDFREIACRDCARGADLGFDFTMAFQPIIDVAARAVFAHEALVRGPEGQGAGWVFERVNDGNRYRFDQVCRVKAVELASRLGMAERVSINFLPNAVYRPELCIRTTLAAAEEYRFPTERMVFEVTESEKITDIAHVRGIIQHYKARGFTTAIDDFGAGYAGLNLLADLQTDLVKLDMALVRGIHTDRARRAIVRGIMEVGGELGIRVIAEGVETRDEYQALRDLGIDLFQGYLIAKPAFRALAQLTPEGQALLRGGMSA